jgi:hypothetical protein
VQVAVENELLPSNFLVYLVPERLAVEELVFRPRSLKLRQFKDQLALFVLGAAVPVELQV